MNAIQAIQSESEEPIVLLFCNRRSADGSGIDNTDPHAVQGFYRPTTRSKLQFEARAPCLAATTPVRAALYLRVSTGRQADSDLSIPDQRRQAKTYCASRGWEIVTDYVEPGLSATDDRNSSA